MHIFLAITFSNDCQFASLLAVFLIWRPLYKDTIIKHKWKDYTNKQDNVQQVSLMQNKQLHVVKFIFVIMTVHYPLKHLSVTLLLLLYSCITRRRLCLFCNSGLVLVSSESGGTSPKSHRRFKPKRASFPACFMGVWRVEDRAVQLIGDVSSQTSLSECVLIWRGQRAVKHQKCVMSKREESGPPGPLLIQTPRGHHGQIHHELSVLSGVSGRAKWTQLACACKQFPNRRSETRLWGSCVRKHGSPRFIGCFPAKKSVCCQRWCHKTPPDVLRC